MRWNALLVIPVIAACPLAFSRDAEASFVASDFEFAIATAPTFKPGDIVVFDAILTNVSSEIAVFGENIAGAGFSFDLFIGAVPGFTSPYFEGFTGGAIANQSIAPGASVQFPLGLVDTTFTIPLGTTVTFGPGNFLFQNIPPSTPDPLVDFFIGFSEATATASVPASDTLLLLGIGVFTLFGFNSARTATLTLTRSCGRPHRATDVGKRRAPRSGVPHTDRTGVVAQPA